MYNDLYIPRGGGKRETFAQTDIPIPPLLETLFSPVYRTFRNELSVSKHRQKPVCSRCCPRGWQGIEDECSFAANLNICKESRKGAENILFDRGISNRRLSLAYIQILQRCSGLSVLELELRCSPFTDTRFSDDLAPPRPKLLTKETLSPLPLPPCLDNTTRTIKVISTAPPPPP